MRKIITIAGREYRAMVATKAFLISMAMMPLLMFGGIFAMELLQNVGEITERKIIVVDRSDKLFDQLNLAAGTRNQLLDKSGQNNGDEENSSDQKSGSELTDQQVETKSKKQTKTGKEKLREDFGSFAKGTRYELVRWESDAFEDQDRLELSQQIRNQELYAFIEIPEDVLTAELPTNIEDVKSLPFIKFYSEDSNFSEAKGWIGAVVNEFVKQHRLKEFNVDPLTVARASLPIRMKGLGLVEKSSSGEIQNAKEKDDLSAIFLPLGVMMLMFMVIFMASQPMLESVIEEKSQRIAEVLLGSANPFQLMAGKLWGTVGGSLTIFAIYLTGGYFLAYYRGWTEHIPLNLIPWFLVFQVSGVLFFAAIFMAIGASVTQLKEAQSMLLPVWMLLMSPMFVWFMVVREPNGNLATYFSLFPPATPTMMVLRMSTGATIPMWQPILGFCLLIISTVIVIYIAARIFRVGLLWQGKTPKFSEMVKWAFRG